MNAVGVIREPAIELLVILDSDQGRGVVTQARSRTVWDKTWNRINASLANARSKDARRVASQAKAATGNRQVRSAKPAHKGAYALDFA